MHNLAYMYMKGLGLENNNEKAFELYTKSADLGNRDAMCNLGYMYDKGIYVDKNYEKAFELYTKSANLGDKYAMYNLGNMYEKGLYVEKDYVKAIDFYNEFGKENAKERIRKIVKNNINIFIDNLNKVKSLQEEIKKLNEYVVHLETLPFGKEYQNALNEFNELSKLNPIEPDKLGNPIEPDKLGNPINNEQYENYGESEHNEINYIDFKDKSCNDVKLYSIESDDELSKFKFYSLPDDESVDLLNSDEYSDLLNNYELVDDDVVLSDELSDKFDYV